MPQETIVNKPQLLKALDALAELIYDWNQLARDDDRGPDHDALVLLLADDGSGYLATGWPETEIPLNKQCEFAEPAECVDYLADWLKYDQRDLEELARGRQATIDQLRAILHVGAQELIAALMSELQALQAENDRLHTRVDDDECQLDAIHAELNRLHLEDGGPSVRAPGRVRAAVKELVEWRIGVRPLRVL